MSTEYYFSDQDAERRILGQHAAKTLLRFGALFLSGRLKQGM